MYCSFLRHAYERERQVRAGLPRRRSGIWALKPIISWLMADGLSHGSRSVCWWFLERKTSVGELAGSRIDQALAKGAFDVRLCPGVVGLSEDSLGWALFYQLAQIKEDQVIGESSRLTERVRHEDYRVVLF